MTKLFTFWQIWLIICQTISTNFRFCRIAFLSFLYFLMCFCSWYMKCITMRMALKWMCPLSFTWYFKMGSSLIRFLYFPHSRLWWWSTCASCTSRLRLFRPFQNLLFWENLLLWSWISLKKDCRRRHFGEPCEHQPYCWFCFQLQKTAEYYLTWLTKSCSPLCLVGKQLIFRLFLPLCSKSTWFYFLDPYLIVFQFLVSICSLPILFPVPSNWYKPIKSWLNWQFRYQITGIKPKRKG